MGSYCSINDQKTSGWFLKKTYQDKCKKSYHQSQSPQQQKNRLSTHEQYLTSKYEEIKPSISNKNEKDIFITQIIQSPVAAITSKFPLAMKKIQKSKIVTRSARDSIYLQNKIMTQFTNPFLAKIRFSFEDHLYLYFFTDVAKGGDLLSFIQNPQKRKKMEQCGETCIEFIIAGVILALESLHSNKIIYQSFSPQNILFSQDGYPFISNFCFSTQQQESKLQKKWEQLLFLPPEIKIGKTYDRAVDLWGLGVLLYFIIFKDYPFQIQDILDPQFAKICLQKENFHKIHCNYASLNAKSLINQLLKTNKQERIGYKNWKDLKKHKFFENIKWQQYSLKKSKSPFEQIIKEFLFLQEQSSKIKNMNELIRKTKKQNIQNEKDVNLTLVQ